VKTYNGEFLTRPELEALGVTCGGDDVRVHVSVVIINPEGLVLGNHVRIDPFCVLSATKSIRLHDRVHIAGHCTLMGGGGIEFEEYTGASHGARLISAADDFTGRYLAGPMVPEHFRSIYRAPITLKRYSMIGAAAVILPGVTLGEGSIVGASSFVRKSIPEWTIWAGVPAKRIGTRKKDVLALEALLASGASQPGKMG
jgi:acetyltransferase-like isoleucine patch superfamily enzyme